MDNAIEKIESFQRFGSILGLERISNLLKELGNPEKDLKCIHVAGTNGKGSICKYLYEALRKGNYSVGLYTSPFLEVFNERIEIDGKMITDKELDEYTSRVLEKVNLLTERGEDSPTEFEVITAIAFLYFKENNVDFVVLEVGLGGRGDSTNVIQKPLASVIASISYDHTDRLGDTLTAIATEKAGIIKKNCPVITSATSVEALTVFRNTALSLGCKLYETKNIPYTIKSKSIYGTNIIVDDIDIMLTMLGNYQIENAICAYKALQVLNEEGKINLSKEAIIEGFKLAKQIGRFEILDKYILDGAHNPDGSRTLEETVKDLLPDKRILLVIGMLKDKDVIGALSHFTNITSDLIVTEPPNLRKMDALDLKDSILKINDKLNVLGTFSDYKEAIILAKSISEEYDYIIFAGSLYLIGAVRTLVK